VHDRARDAPAPAAGRAHPLARRPRRLHRGAPPPYSRSLTLPAHPPSYPPEAAGLGLEPVDPARVVVVDGRDLDARERTLLDAHGVARLTPAEAARELAGQPVFVHLDADVLGSDRIAGLDFPVPGGPAPDAIAALLGGLDVTAIEVTALPPDGVALVASLVDPLIAG